MGDNDFWGTDLFGEEPDWANSDDDDGDNEKRPLTFGSQHVVLLMDCHSDMFIPDKDGNSPMDLSLELAKTLLTETVRTAVTLQTGKRNGVGLVLYNTKPRKKIDPDEEEEDSEEEEEEDEDTIPRGDTAHVLQELEVPGIPHVKELLKYIKKKENLKSEYAFDWDDKKNYPRVSPLQTALECSLRMFTKAKCVRKSVKAEDPVDSKTIWIFTNRERDPACHTTLIQNIAGECHEQNIDIIVWPLHSPKTTEFDHQAFFHDVSNKIFFEERLSSSQDLNEGLEQLSQSWKRVRRGYHGPMRLPGWREHDSAIMVDFFKLVSFKKRPNSVKIDLQSNLETSTSVTYVDNTNNEVFAIQKRGNTTDQVAGNAGNIGANRSGFAKTRSFADFVGAELIPFSQSDLKEMRNLCNGKMEGTNLSFWGFKAIDSIPFYHTIEGSYLVYPQVDDGKRVKENRKAFSNLHAAMLKKQVCAIGEFLGRSTWSSKLVAVYPLAEELHTAHEGEEEEDRDEELKQKRPPGLAMVPLPFEDDIRMLELDEAMKELRIQVSIKEDLVLDNDVKQKGSSPVPEPIAVESSSSIDRGNIASEELVTAAMQLIDAERLTGYEIAEDFDNAGLERFFNYVEAIALGHCNTYEDLEKSYDTVLDEETVLSIAQNEIENFRKLLPDDVVKSRAAGKKRKIVEDDSGLDWEELLRQDALDACTLPTMKKYLRSKGAPLSGKKADIVDRVKTLLLKQMATKQNGTTIKREV